MRRNIALAAAAALVASLVAVSAIPAAASTPSTTCQTGDGIPFCVLVIAAPSSVRTGSAFTVQVLVTTDGTVNAKSDPCGSKVAVTLEVSGEPLDGPLSFTALASAGIATFSLTLQDLGSYDLFASGPQLPDAAAATSTSCQTYHYEPDSTSLLAVSIPLDQPVAPCPPDTNCVQATSGSGTQATLIAEPGSTWTPKFSGDTYFGSVTQSGHACASGPIDSNGVLGFTLLNTSQTGVIVLALDTTQVTKGIGLFNVCWHQQTYFTSVSGALVTTGDLPNCRGRDQVAPCVLSRTSGQHNVAFLSILTPAGDPDPFAYGHF
jgi:hypothetical protein